MLKAVVKTMADNGGRVLDSTVAEGQQVTGMIARDLGIQNRVFWSTGLPLPPAPQSAGIDGRVGTNSSPSACIRSAF